MGKQEDMGIFSKVFGKLVGKKDCRILMVGLDAAGKTTLLYKLKLGEVITIIPTIGFNVENLQYQNADTSTSWTCWDVGGKQKIRPLWRHYIDMSNALVFMVDSNDHARMDEARKEL